MKPIHILLMAVALTVSMPVLAHTSPDSTLIAKANQGDAQSQFLLGVASHKQQHYALAKYYWELAAAQGDAKAQYNLGLLYIKGQGVRQDYRTAKEWYGKACDNGDQLGCDNYRKLQQIGY